MISNRLFIASVFSLLLCACASGGSPTGGEYDEPVVPGKTKIHNLTGAPTTEGAARVYLEARNEGGGRHGKLLAVGLDDQALEGANNSPLSMRGYQALAIKPGKHVVNVCFLGQGTFGSTGNCKVVTNAYQFEANQDYMIQYTTHWEGARQILTVFTTPIETK